MTLPLTQAKKVMDKHGIRHLPVLEGGKLVGLISDRDVQMISSLSQVDFSDVTVEEAMSQAVYTVGPGTSLLSAAKEMARRKLGSVVVTDGGKVVGVFTTTDGMRVLADLLGSASPSRAPGRPAPKPSAKRPAKR
jgi:acetoin utilization protein AcuB